MRLPDFIIAGAPRSGTTWLYRVLACHPRIRMARPPRPEPKFFLLDHLFRRGLAYYSSTWFTGIGPDLTAGEKSTNYLESPVAARRIHDCLPRVKLVFLLREPVARAYSNYLWSRMNGLEDEDFPRALALEEERERNLPEALKYARPHAYFSRGLYARLLAPYFDLFPRSALLVMRYEDIGRSPENLTERVHRFLGVAPRGSDGLAPGVVNPADRSGAPPLPEEVAEDLAERYREPNARLADLLGREFVPWEAM